MMKPSLPSIPMMDTHVHLYDPKYANDIDEVILRSQQAGVTRAYMPNLNGQTLAPMLALTKKYPHFCRPMLGLHPCDVTADYRTLLAPLEKALGQHPFVAIGEIGLDFYHSTQFRKAQYEALTIQLQWAKSANLPVVLHGRDSLPELITTIAKSQHHKGIFHCFTGTLAQAKAIIDLGFYLGIGGIITYPKNKVLEVVKAVSLSAIVLETDGPYLAPQSHRGKRNEPSYLLEIAETIATAKGLSLTQVLTQIHTNVENIWGRFEKQSLC